MDTITAIATPAGTGGIAVIRLSGTDAIAIADSVWRGTPLSKAHSHTAHLGEITDTDGSTLDQAVATVFAPGHSYTGEATVEFSIHGARWLQNAVLTRLIGAGARIAVPGEFSRRAVINGRMDLAQAEGVADLIAASSKAAQRLAAMQMKGDFSRRLDSLRQQLIDLASLLELELDFSEEDVEFADRARLESLSMATLDEIRRLAGSFRTGRALKEGVAVVIAGVPNAGKSTLLNRLLDDEKAIVSDVPGTTRDIIEDTVEINGILFRFIDTAGLRDTQDHVERIGIDRARHQISRADILMHLFDPTTDAEPQIEEFNRTLSTLSPDTIIIPLLTKTDSAPIYNPEIPATQTPAAHEIRSHIATLATQSSGSSQATQSSQTPHSSQPSQNSQSPLATQPSQAPSKPVMDFASPVTPTPRQNHIDALIEISARTEEGLDQLLKTLNHHALSGHDPSQELIVTNLRHYQALTDAAEALDRTRRALADGLPADLVAQDLRQAIHHLSLITGAITTDTLLHTIFSRFCIGK